MESCLRINGLPSEILGAIFEAGKPGKATPYKIPYEIGLSHVSSHWRAVAHSTPSLWTRIYITSVLTLDVVSRYMERSGGLPIDIRIDIYREDKKAKVSTSLNSSLADMIMDVISPHVARCQTLLIFPYYGKTAQDFIARLFDFEAPMLERLKINFDYRFGASVTDPGLKTIFCRGTPRLRFLETDVLHSLPPLSSVTTLQLHGVHLHSPMTYENLSEIAASAPHLEHLSLRGIADLTSWPLHFVTPELRMNSLRSLLIENGPLAVKLLLSLSAPNLQSLWLECYFDNFQLLYDSPQFSGGENKFSSLHYLTLHRTYGHEYISMARAFPSVHCLHLSYPSGNYHLRNIEELFGVNGQLNELLWRELHTIVMRTIGYPEQHVSKLLQVLSRVIPLRRDVGLPMKRLLTDTDIYRNLSKPRNVSLAEQIELAIVDTYNYCDPWWIMSHEDVLDCA
ncbi:hypothetical protein BDQ17DRAFT_1537369 [Cyathus striatus]|nr:hypothetical protein BDQ17DRAFT_1537369 [Cyathus striatus]